MLETLIGVGLLVVVVFVAKTIFARTGSSLPRTPIGGGGTPSEPTTNGNETIIPSKDGQNEI